MNEHRNAIYERIRREWQHHVRIPMTIEEAVRDAERRRVFGEYLDRAIAKIRARSTAAP